MILRIVKPLPGRRVGDEVRVETDASGNPLEVEWRRRLRDAKVDGCVEVVREAPSAPRVKSKGGPVAADKE